MWWKVLQWIQFLFIMIMMWTIPGAAEETGTNYSLPYPFQPPSEEFCRHNELGSDMYISVFSPCVFTFYKGRSNITQEESFSCVGIANSTNNNAIIVSVKESKVVGWPDSCVANGPRCYDLSKYKDLSNFTLYGESTIGYYGMTFPDDANYLSVDCSRDYQIAKEAMSSIPETIEPLRNAIIFFGVMVLLGSLICCFVCCVCICNAGERQREKHNYTVVGPAIYDGKLCGPPVEAKRIIL